LISREIPRIEFAVRLVYRNSQRGLPAEFAQRLADRFRSSSDPSIGSEIPLIDFAARSAQFVVDAVSTGSLEAP
jgi:hypothetical protein